MLTQKQAEEIRGRIVKGEKVADLAVEFAVTKATIYAIKHNISFKDTQKKHFKHFTHADAQIIRNRVANGESMYSLAKEHQIPYATIQNIIYHKTYKEIPADILTAFQNGDWVAFDLLENETGFAANTLKNWVEKDQYQLIQIQYKWYIERAGAEKYKTWKKIKDTMIPLNRAASVVGLTFQRLHQLKDAGRITTIQVGGIYYVDPEYLQQELHQRFASNSSRR